MSQVILKTAVIHADMNIVAGPDTTELKIASKLPCVATEQP